MPTHHGQAKKLHSMADLSVWKPSIFTAQLISVLTEPMSLEDPSGRVYVAVQTVDLDKSSQKCVLIGYLMISFEIIYTQIKCKN